MYKCECSREFEKKQSFCAHQGHCRVHMNLTGKSIIDRFGDTRAYWRGKSKDTEPGLKSMSEKLKLHVGTLSPFYGKTHTAEFKSKMSSISRDNARNHINGWKSGDNRIPNKYEEATINFLDTNDIRYEREVVLRKSSIRDTDKGYYQLDFLVNDTIDLEIDGSSHNKDHDSARDSLVSMRYRVYRIRHLDSVEELLSKLEEFLSYINMSNVGSSPTSDTINLDL